MLTPVFAETLLFCRHSSLVMLLEAPGGEAGMCAQKAVSCFRTWMPIEYDCDLDFTLLVVQEVGSNVSFCASSLPPYRRPYCHLSFPLLSAQSWLSYICTSEDGFTPTTRRRESTELLSI